MSIYTSTEAPSTFDEHAAEFNAEVPNWEARLAFHDGLLVDERDFPLHVEPEDGWHRPSEDDWGWFREQMFTD